MHLLKDENGNVIPHGDGPAHKHEHDHDHGCEEHACDGCSGGSDKCKNESVALLNYIETVSGQMSDASCLWIWQQTGGVPVCNGKDWCDTSRARRYRL